MQTEPIVSESIASAAWQPLSPRAVALYRLTSALLALLPAVPGWVLFTALLDGQGLPVWAATLLLAVALAALGAAYGQRRWHCTRWQLDTQGLRVQRGWLWRREILVPRSRVQHLDIERGPLERRRQLATLVVHTAGTRVHALRQPGLDDADAVALRDALVPAAERHDDAL